MTPLSKFIFSLTSSKAAISATTPYMFVPMRKLVLASSTRMCHGAKETAVAKKEAPKTAVSQNENENETIMHSTQKRKLDLRDRFVLYLFSEKGKYKSIKDVPTVVSYYEMGKAYDMQRVYGMLFCMVVSLVVAYLFVKWQKKDIEESEYHGQRLWEASKAAAEIGAPPPNITKRHKEEWTGVPDYKK